MKKNVWIAGMAAILSAGLVWAAPVFTLADERIPDGVSVGAVSLSGLTEEEAEKQIESYVNEKLNQDITLVVNGTEAKSDAQTLGVAWDNRDEVAKAIQGTELKGNLVKRYMKKKDLEAMARVSHYTMNKLTHGDNVTTDVLGRICNALGCSLDDIMEFVAE